MAAKFKRFSQARAERRIKELAARIPDNRALISILATAKPGLRRDCYEQFKPHLQFTPIPFESMGFDGQETVQ